jgi:flagellar basal-body rod modification protein FlgD
MTTTTEINSLFNTGASLIKDKNSTVLGKEDFLQLLVTQLKNQDPLNPADPTAFTAQLAQFSSLEQLFNVNQTLEKVNTSNAELERLSALSMLGKQIVSKSENFRLIENGSVQLGYHLDEPVGSVQIHIQDSLKRTVATIAANQLGTGDHWLAWDGTGSNGQVAPPGDYTLAVSALSGDDETMPISALISGIVTGIEIDKNGNTLTTNCGEYSLNSIKRVIYQ